MNIGTLVLVTRTVKTRKYDGTGRRAAAESTRGEVLRSARELFARRGYATTAVSAIADGAGVSVDTVYASVGRKPQLLLAVHDMALAGGEDPVAAERRDYVQAIRAAGSAAAKIRVYADALGRVLPDSVPLMNALREAGSTDPECKRVCDSVNERRAANMLLFAADLRTTGELREDLDDQQVADLVWSMNSPEYFTLFTSRGRSHADYAAMLVEVWTRVLLR